MSPFASQPTSQATAANSSGFRPAWIVFVLCLLIGFVVVGWRAKARADKAKSRAQLEALARGAALETQFNQAISAAEVLGGMIRQGNGTMPEFQKIASELLAARPGLGSLELQPGGVVTDIVPKPGNERIIGMNILKDPGAVAARENHALTISVMRLYSGEPGFIVRLPVFRGRDSFWGFVSGSIRLPHLKSRSRLDELSREGYHYALLANGSPGQRQMTVALEGAVYLDEAIQFPIQVQNLKFILALQAKRGWYDTAKILYEALGVLILSGILCLLVNMVESRREIEAALADANRKLLRESADRRQAQEESLAARDEAAAAVLDLKKIRSALEQTQPTILELQGQLAATGNTQAKLEGAEAQLKAAESKVRELESQFQAELKAAEQSARAKEGELDQAQANLNQAQQMISDLQTRLAAATRAEKQAAAAAQKQHEQDQARITDLQVRVDAAAQGAGAANEAAERKIRELEKTNDELRERLAVTEQAEAQVQELTEERKSAKPPKRKKRSDSQMDLFGESSAQVSSDAPVSGEMNDSVLADSQSSSNKVSSEMGIRIGSDPEAIFDSVQEEPESKEQAKEDKPARRYASNGPVDEAELRKAVHEILPLFIEKDPGAKDCLKANRNIFRSAFNPEGYQEFEQAVKGADFTTALEILRKVARRHGISA